MVELARESFYCSDKRNAGSEQSIKGMAGKSDERDSVIVMMKMNWESVTDPPPQLLLTITIANEPDPPDENDSYLVDVQDRPAHHSALNQRQCDRP